MFYGNSANHQGGAITSYKYSNVSFEGDSSIVFSDNTARRGGAIFLNNSYVYFKGNSNVTFYQNTGGVIFSDENGSIYFEGNSTTVFSNNTAGGAIYIQYNSNISFQENSNTIFSNNYYTAVGVNGGVLSAGEYCNIFFQGNSNTVFSNSAADYGGALYLYLSCNIFFKEKSVTLFSNIIAHYTGIIQAESNSGVIFDDNSTVTFNETFGMTVFCKTGSIIKAQGNFSVIFNDHPAKWCSKICLPYTGQFDSTVIDRDGFVWCNNQRWIYCLSSKCDCRNLKDIIIQAADNNNTSLHINILDNAVVLSSQLFPNMRRRNVSIVGHNTTVLCVNGGTLLISPSRHNPRSVGYHLSIKGIAWIGCGSGNSDIYVLTAVLSIVNYDNVTIQECSFQYSVDEVIILEIIEYANIIDCIFENTGFIQTNVQNGVAIVYSRPNVSVLTLKNCNFTFNRGIENIINIVNQHTNTIVYLINSVFSNNKAVSVNLQTSHGSSTLHINGKTLFENNVAENGAGISAIDSTSTVIFGENSNATFFNNSVDHNGAAMYLDHHSTAIFDSNSIVTFVNNKASNGIIYSKSESSVVFKGICHVTFSGNSVTKNGSAIYSADNSQLIFTENATVMFSNNNVMSSNGIYIRQGGTIFSEYSGNISFEENSITIFNDNQADFGAALYSIRNLNIIFKNRSIVLFNNHTVNYCGVLTTGLFSNVKFSDHTNVTFITNTVSHAILNGYESSAGAICTFQNCNITFSDNSSVTFINNRADRGGAALIDDSTIIIEKYSTVTFYNNFAWYSSGGAFVCSKKSSIVVQDNAIVIFDGNKASENGGAIYSNNLCKITFKDNSTSTFVNNSARDNGGALFSSQLHGYTVEGNSQVTFINNTSDNGGALYFSNFTIKLKESSTVSFYNNLARQNGGVGYCSNGTMMTEDNAIIRFYDNMAEKHGGALYIDMCNIIFKDTSTSSFYNNTVSGNGSAIFSHHTSKVMFVGNSTVKFNSNIADNGGALYFDNYSDGILSGFTNVSFQHNTAFYGAAMLANDHCNIILRGKSSLMIANNEAMQIGGGGYLRYRCNFIVQENASVIVDNNKALHSGGIYITSKVKVLFKDNSNALFSKNLATVGGGAVKVFNNSNITVRDCTTIKFIDNNAQYGGAIFLDSTAVMTNRSNYTGVYFASNTAKFLGDSVYQETTESFSSSSEIYRTVGISSEFIATPPNNLKFSCPATCIDEDINMHCKQYFVQNVMLGKEIAIPACVLDYYNHTVHSAQFKVQNEKNRFYDNTGPNQILVSCNQSVRVNITGNQSLSKLINFTINFTLNTVLNPNWKHVSVNLIIELSPCHPGFWHYRNTMKCECYNDNDIVVCSDSSSSMIKRGYWFGSVAGKPTVAFCPINYCNFTCCETSNGYYQLSPVRDNQCRSHRSGIACGSCEEGYTLSFDSIECLDLNECTTGQTILVLALILLYWIVIIMAVFSLMRFKVEIGYLYAITYYYSVVDLLLNQNWYLSSVLNTTINIISSTAKIIPQYLGKFYFIKNMSGIDQQFIHYIHPVAVSLFLIMITILARRSRRLASFISKGIIHVICYLLLLSYTSVATTSLLLMKPLIFHDVDKVYTYVSPDIEYLHGRHLAYAIVAVIYNCNCIWSSNFARTRAIFKF